MPEPTPEPSPEPSPGLPAEIAERFDRIAQRPVVLRLEGLGRSFLSPRGGRITALRGVGLEVRRREFITVIGPSGCGKSTLIRLVAGLDTPTEGRILLDDRPVVGAGPDRGMVFQAYTLFPWLSVKRNVMFGPRVTGRGPIVAEREACQWIEMVGLAGFEDHYPHQLSGGMKQRVAIARALANRPRMLLMDEPFGALDARTRAQMQDYLLQIYRNVELMVLFITHDLDEAVYLADRVVVMGRNPGHIMEVVKVPLPRPRDPQMLFDPQFIETKRRIEHLIHPSATDEADDEPAKRNLPVGRMTIVGDEVY